MKIAVRHNLIATCSIPKTATDSSPKNFSRNELNITICSKDKILLNAIVAPDFKTSIAVAKKLSTGVNKFCPNVFFNLKPSNTIQKMTVVKIPIAIDLKPRSKNLAQVKLVAKFSTSMTLKISFICFSIPSSFKNCIIYVDRISNTPPDAKIVAYDFAIGIKFSGTPKIDKIGSRNINTTADKKIPVHIDNFNATDENILAAFAFDSPIDSIARVIAPKFIHVPVTVNKK